MIVILPPLLPPSSSLLASLSSSLLPSLLQRNSPPSDPPLPHHTDSQLLREHGGRKAVHHQCKTVGTKVSQEKKNIFPAQKIKYSPPPSRLHYVVQGYKEILLYIQQMSKSSDENLQESAKVIMSNMFYHSEYREVVVTLLRNFYEVFQTRAFLRDTVETAHAYTKMMEQYSGQNQHMVVQERRRGGGKGGAKKKKKKG